MKSNQLLVAVFSFLFLTMLVLSHIVDLFPQFESTNLCAACFTPNQTSSMTSTTTQQINTPPQTITPESLSNITPNDFQSKIINPVLLKLHIYSPSASRLLLGTAVQESLIGKLSNNIFQITLSTAKDINKNYLSKHPNLQASVNNFYVPQHTLSWNLKNNVNYQTALASLVYLKTNKPLPDADDPQALGKFWKINYNTYDGRGSAKEYANNLEFYLSNDDTPVSDIAT